MTIQTPDQVAVEAAKDALANGIPDLTDPDRYGRWVTWLSKHFAAAIAADRRALLAADREKVAAMMLRLSIATGHGDTLDDLLIELEGQLKEIML